MLQFRAFTLFDGWKPASQSEPVKPAGYDDLVWADTLAAVPDVEQAYRIAMSTKQKDRTTKSVRELGGCSAGINQIRRCKDPPTPN